MDALATETDDARQDQRADMQRGAVIVPGNGKPEFRCLLTNMSGDGAEIAVEPGQRIPPRFMLQVPRDGMAYRAEVRWREEGRIGVMFTGSEKTGKPILAAVV